MGAGNMYPEIFERVLHDVEGISENWQVAVRQEGIHDILEFRLELTNGIEPLDGRKRRAEKPRSPLPGRLGEPALRHVPARVSDFRRASWKQGRKPRRLVDETQGVEVMPAVGSWAVMVTSPDDMNIYAQWSRIPARPIVFTDFDGTITQLDVTDEILAQLAHPSWREVEQEWTRGLIGSRECLERQIALVDASAEEFDALIDAVPIDPAFAVSTVLRGSEAFRSTC